MNFKKTIDLKEIIHYYAGIKNEVILKLLY